MTPTFCISYFFSYIYYPFFLGEELRLELLDEPFELELLDEVLDEVLDELPLEDEPILLLELDPPLLDEDLGLEDPLDDVLEEVLDGEVLS